MNQNKKLTRKDKFNQPNTTSVNSKINTKEAPNNEKYYLLIICLLGFVLYANTFNNGYVLDDFSVIKENNVVNQGIKNISKIFSTSYRYGYLNVNDGLYRPLSLAMFAVEWSISPSNTFLGHFINVLLYMLCGVVIFKTFKKIVPNINLLFLFCFTMLFMVHPIHTEVVGNIKSRDELLCFLFTFLAISKAWNYLDGKSIINGILSAVFLFLALLAKESGVLMIPIFILLVLFFHAEKVTSKSTIIVSILGVTLLLYLIIRNNVLGTVTGIQTIALIDNPIGANPILIEKVAGSFQVLLQYFELFVFPHPLIYDYSYNSIPLNTIESAIAAIVILVLLVFSFVFYKKQPLISFAILFIFLSLSLYSNLIVSIGAAKAERFTFLASLGFCLALCFLIFKLLKIPIDYQNKSDNAQFPKPLLITFVVVISLYSIKVISRNRDWKNNMTLYENDVLLNPQSAKAHYYLGNEIIKEVAPNEKDTAKSRLLYNRGINEVLEAVKIFPEYSDGYTELGVGHYKLNQFDTAAFYLSKALEINPTNSVALSNLGSICFNIGKFDDAIKYYQKTLSLNPRFTDALLNLGSCYGMTKQFDLAIESFQKVLSIDPANEKALTFLAFTYQNIGDKTKADYYNSLVPKH